VKKNNKRNLRKLAAAAYQFAGAHEDTPVEWLDALSEAASGRPFKLKGLLPFCPKQNVKSGHA
jgi:hypothetical protein